MVDEFARGGEAPVRLHIQIKEEILLRMLRLRKLEERVTKFVRRQHIGEGRRRHCVGMGWLSLSFSLPICFG